MLMLRGLIIGMSAASLRLTINRIRYLMPRRRQGKPPVYRVCRMP